MSADMYAAAQRRTGEGWVGVPLDPRPFNWTRYAMFGFLADVRNLHGIPTLSPQRDLPADHGLPEDWVEMSNVRTWFTLEELRTYDYDTLFVDVRTLPARSKSVRDALEANYFVELQRLADAGVERVVFAFVY